MAEGFAKKWLSRRHGVDPQDLEKQCGISVKSRGQTFLGNFPSAWLIDVFKPGAEHVCSASGMPPVAEISLANPMQ